MKTNLPPLNLEPDVSDYKAFAEKTEVSFTKCSHKNIRFQNDSLLCQCGVGFTGPRLNELYEALTK